MIEIKSRFTGATLHSVDAPTIKGAVEALVGQRADLEGASLMGANLEGANFEGANLMRADLRGANLWGADLMRADLRGANLMGSNLMRADLRRANLWDADLRGADLRGAYLRGADLNWQSHALLSHILATVAGDDIQKRMVAGLIAVSTDWCWETLLAIENEQREWALSELAKWMVPGDSHPTCLDAYRDDTLL